MFLTEKFAEFIVGLQYEKLPPPDVIYQAKERIMDTWGAAVAGCTNWEYSDRYLHAATFMGRGDAPVIQGKGISYTVPVAAMLNATFAHAVELDDGHRNAGCHAGAVIVPTALTMGYAMGKTGREIIEAVVAGYEITYRLAVAVSPDQINNGFHPSSNCGAFGAAAVACKLMQLSKEQTANALGQSGMLACGTMEATTSGQRSKCVQVGKAAFNGIMAAYLAGEGMEGCVSALEGKNGFFNLQSGHVDIESVCEDLGTRFVIADTYNKLYPCCRHAQPGIEAVINLAVEKNIRPEDVESIWIGTHKVAYDLTGIIKAPRNSGEAKFSLAYGAATALYTHNFGVNDLQENRYREPSVLALAEKVACAIDEEVQSVYPKKRGAKVSIKATDGAVYETEVYDLKGSPNNPVGWKELADKFVANVTAVIEKTEAEKLLKQLYELEKYDDIRFVIDIFA